ncbi:glycine betaine ABC transporter substrate-binding protein [Sporosarcina sp. FSL K6-1540]|uniref:Glycine betaine/choline ABC-type transport system substrate-binding protein n=1 Tax=Sporosarcina psychrophila TaxID=1476 RepID=A0ABV2K835_SPOPS|nr:MULTISPECIES: glycine betaine ABC transporter substrate-binding protein [Sporosarcina]AMQ04894.1 glycine/betaine ABC transporter substrate-binding protein [Sporosarcina psychrophila]QNK88617.1 glycine/betaine ABC transporter substrate-binding protein [Sporosarcina sp. resist]
MKKGLGIILMSLTLLLGACGGKDEIVISGKPWTEQFILPHILGQYIEAETDYKVKYKDGLGEVAIMTPALEKGDIDLYVEYTGTGLKDVLKEESKAGESSESVLERVKKGYEDKFGVTWLEPLGFENGYTLAFTKDKEYNAKTYSDLAGISADEEMIFGAPHAFYERKGDGYDDMVISYPFTFKDTKSLDPNVMYEAVKNGDVDVIPAFTTDSRIQMFDLATTEDDLGFFPKYDAAPVVRQETLKKFPELEKVLNSLAGKITEEDMLKMNARVDLDKEKPEDVARAFLIEKELIKE